MVQSRNVYVTGNAELDRILNDLSERLDTIEGLRPDLDAGFYQLDTAKDISTGNPVDFDYVTITDDDITITAADNTLITLFDASGITLTSSDGNIITINGHYIEIKDENGAIIFKLGSWTL